MLFPMICREISIGKIDLTKELFRISEELVTAPLQSSLRAIGQLNPVLLMGADPPYTVVCGFRRLNALRELSASHVIARIIEKQDTDLAALFELALWDNLSHRDLDPLEKARVLYKLRNDFRVPDDAIIKDYLSRMDLARNSQVLHTHIRLHEVHPGLKSHFKEGRLTLSTLQYLGSIPASSQESIASVLVGMRLSAGLQKKFFGLLQDLAAKNGTGPEVPLETPEVQSVLRDAGLSPYQRGEKVCALLYRLRYPRVVRAEERFSERRKSLGLPGSIRVTPAPYFEIPDLRVEFSAPDAERFREKAARLFEASQNPDLDSLFKVT